MEIPAQGLAQDIGNGPSARELSARVRKWKGVGGVWKNMKYSVPKTAHVRTFPLRQLPRRGAHLQQVRRQQQLWQRKLQLEKRQRKLQQLGQRQHQQQQ